MTNMKEQQTASSVTPERVVGRVPGIPPIKPDHFPGAQEYVDHVKRTPLPDLPAPRTPTKENNT